eukprot:10117923-Lingulodinium_polyedra.AAC.1
MLEPHSAGRPQLAAATLQGGLRLGAPTFSPSQDGERAVAPLQRAALAAARPSAQKQMLGDA